eukprot:119286_1
MKLAILFSIGSALASITHGVHTDILENDVNVRPDKDLKEVPQVGRSLYRSKYMYGNRNYKNDDGVHENDFEDQETYLYDGDGEDDKDNGERYDDDGEYNGDNLEVRRGGDGYGDG